MTDPTLRWRLAANTSDSPVLVTDDGRILGGGEYGPADTTSTAAQDALQRGVLVYPDPPRKNAGTPAAQAQGAVDKLNASTDSEEKR